MTGTEIELGSVADGKGTGGVAHGDVLIAFTDAVMANEPEAMARTRDAVTAALGEQAVADAAGVIAMFNIVDRVADATGIPIDEGGTHDLRYAIGSELGMDGQTPEARAAR